MALYPLHKYFVFNREIQPVNLFIPSENEGGIYEVIRVSRGVPLFIEDHLERFLQSAKIAGKDIFFRPQQIEMLINKLIQKNNVLEGNILLSCKENLKAFFIPHIYPFDEQYKLGVACGLLNAERDNPNAKVFHTTVRAQANKMLEENGFYEVLLVNKYNFITEGSRSNVFFVHRNRILTPPAQKVLLGITRSKIIQLALSLGLTVLEKDISVDNLSSFDAAFLTGTSPKILPVNQIGGVMFGSQNETVRALMYEYDILMDRYIDSKCKD